MIFKYRSTSILFIRVSKHTHSSASRSTFNPTFTMVDDKFIIVNEIQDNRACFSRRQLADKNLVSGIVSFEEPTWSVITESLGGQLMV